MRRGSVALAEYRARSAGAGVNRMRLPRMTTRRWIIAVAVVGLVLATGLAAARLTRRAGEYRQYAVWHRAMRDLRLGEADAIATLAPTGRRAIARKKSSCCSAGLTNGPSRCTTTPWPPSTSVPPASPGSLSNSIRRSRDEFRRKR